MMIDWVTVLIPFPHDTPFNGGNVISISTDGSIDWSVEKRMKVEGSFGSSMQIRSEHKDFHCSHIRLDGNPVKFMQGHNVWGSTDLHGLITASMIKIMSMLEPERNTSGIQHFCLLGHLTRVDLNCMYDLVNGHNVLAWLRAASDAASISHRGRGQFAGDTLYWGKSSRRWSLKAYWKGGELKKHRPKPTSSDGYHPTDLDSVKAYADRALRVELVLRGMELTKLCLSEVQFWNKFTFEKVYNFYVGKLNFSENMKIAKQLDFPKDFPPRLIGPVQMWREGHDLRSIYPRPTWYRYKKDIFDRIGLDISLTPPKERPDMSNVVPLIRVLEAVPMGIPDCAVGTDLYFDPPEYPKLQIVK